jgi:hypothetical protein
MRNALNVAYHAGEALSRPVEALIRIERRRLANVSITAPFSYRYGSFGASFFASAGGFFGEGYAARVFQPGLSTADLLSLRIPSRFK